MVENFVDPEILKILAILRTITSRNSQHSRTVEIPKTVVLLEVLEIIRVSGILGSGSRKIVDSRF